MNTSNEARRVVDQSLVAWQTKPGPLLPVLHSVHDALGCIPAEAVPWIAEGLNLSRAEVHGVVSFYHYFRSAPPGRHVIRICRAEACQSMGGRVLEKIVKEFLGIDFHQTTSDRKFTLEPVYCLGNCACSPAVTVDDQIYGRVEPAWLTQHVAALGESS